jgi:hypothetical protein
MHPLVSYFRCPDSLGATTADPLLSVDAGYFRFGGATCYGRLAIATPSRRPGADLPDAASAVSSSDGRVLLPFDLGEVLDNLRFERYAREQTTIERFSESDAAHAFYYFLRPALPIAVRKHLQRVSFAGWRRIPFPHWPVDVTVETLMRQVVRCVLERGGMLELPFVWFWPDGASGCAMVTHDVEGAEGAAFCGALMDLDDRCGVRSAFQVVPAAPWAANGDTRHLVERLQRRGFEVNVHDLAHDGDLFRDREQFLEHAAAINARGREFGSRGFRSGAMYRRQEWFGALDCSYDMSVPNVAHLEPQRGGCCTVMPYFVGDVLELPLTTSQDYTLFHVLGDYSTRLWREQIDLVLGQNGLASFIVHPDYVREARARDVYTELLRLLVQLGAERGVWIAQPGEIDAWWRQRRELRLVPAAASWRIEGPGADRARVAYARIQGDRVVYSVAP